ncbi:MAG TPA: HAMP domain-containing sensor histidine kinase [Actinomycetota bacterium]|nr:HAMP domain-containing sensor histidine kinase [Actinomycetota bacterium]
MRRPRSLAARLFSAQLLVIVVTFTALLVTVVLIAPGLFLHHLRMSGEDSPVVQLHAQEAFETSVGLALLAAAAVAVVAAILLSWFLARRVSRPITELAASAEAVAHGNYDVTVPQAGFGTELHTLSRSFQDMADSLETTDGVRSRLLSDLSHEIRTPLATLEAHIDALEDGVLPSSAENYEVMRDQVHRLRRLASDVRVAAEAQEHALTLHPEPTPVTDLVKTACSLYEARYRDKGVLLSDMCQASSGLEVMVDRDRMQQVLGNLLENALRHTPTGGVVSLDCQRRGHTVEITVTDTGTGIAPEDLDRVFQRFQRLDDARESDSGGSGLGLTIARALIQNQDGDLTAFSQGLGTGSTFVIKLPLWV